MNESNKNNNFNEQNKKLKKKKILFENLLMKGNQFVRICIEEFRGWIRKR